jgi:transposase
VQELRGSTGA